jgi:hypothetical protein
MLIKWDKQRNKPNNSIPDAEISKEREDERNSNT